MRQHAVLITILFTFTVTLVSVSVVFWEFFQQNKQRYINNIFTKHTAIIQIYQEHQQKQNPQIMLEANLAIYGFVLKKDKEIVEIILKNAKILKKKNFQSVDASLMFSQQGFYTKKVITDLTTSMLEFNKKIYFYIQNPSSSILILDEELKPYKYWPVAYSYMIIILIITSSFVLILQRLRPLIRLRKKIALYGNGDMNISFKTRGHDEISLISNELEAAREKINIILESRTLFLRNIMHELKTPIAKGTIATQMLESQKQRDRFSSIFGRLESLVNEFALIEEVTSLGDKTDFAEYRLIDIIDGAIDMAMVDEKNVTVNNVEATHKISANYRLYTTAIKNMIDNGIKYSTDNHVKILIKNGELCFESKGECIAHPLQYYIEPFTKDNPAKNSFGLGLYLVDSILKVHNQVLAHEYENGINRFIFA
ncbi:sensor histidine kinase [Sulfurimonas sp. CVO]|jgi:two-component system OmpR family sensor kinase|uniref:histidine kinase n=1 Tax=Sulfurimonas xiamenensis TaxID=2590021 RepID=A0AAJ4A4N0_9BACT|nr:MULTISPECIES: ArsS family sensor histidine kinase [Sulfurimonas]PLY15881.1 MAG: sensor histidine kinase [Sulfurimonas sp.]QFR43864.1 HAMP domain-containing histidine kinase [Sulfurimonas xiamenensis]QHG90600.1 sensor histidine kinase [Sulfurimonas sp. CVO]